MGNGVWELGLEKMGVSNNEGIFILLRRSQLNNVVPLELNNVVSFILPAMSILFFNKLFLQFQLQTSKFSIVSKSKRNARNFNSPKFLHIPSFVMQKLRWCVQQEIDFIAMWKQLFFLFALQFLVLSAGNRTRCSFTLIPGIKPSKSISTAWLLGVLEFGNFQARVCVDRIGNIVWPSRSKRKNYNSL